MNSPEESSSAWSGIQDAVTPASDSTGLLSAPNLLLFPELTECVFSRFSAV